MLDQKLGLDETLNSQRWTNPRNSLENKFSKFTPTDRSRRRRFPSPNPNADGPVDPPRVCNRFPEESKRNASPAKSLRPGGGTI